MNLERLINMVVNQVIRRLVNLVVDRGVNMASRQMKPSDETSDEEQTRTRRTKELSARSAGVRGGKPDLF